MTLAPRARLVAAMVILGTPLPAFLALSFAVAAAAAIQRAGGQGFGTVVAGFAALFAPDQVPAAVLLLGLLVTALGVGFDFEGVKWRELAPAAIGRAVGTVPAVWIAAAVVGSPLLGPVVGGVILAAVALSLLGLKIAKTRVSLVGAGVLSGFMATLTSVGAAPMGLIYQDEEARAARGTLNAFFLIGLLISLAGLAAEGLVGARHLIFAAALAPAAFAGFWAAGPLTRAMGGRPIRPVALSLATAAAAMLIARGLW